jgi:hypothetical protein
MFNSHLGRNLLSLVHEKELILITGPCDILAVSNEDAAEHIHFGPLQTANLSHQVHRLRLSLSNTPNRKKFLSTFSS